MSKPRKETTEPRGVHCPKCWATWHRTLQTYLLPNGKIRRRRECRYCGRVFYSIEVVSASQN